MSHFTVTVRVSEERRVRHGGDIEAAIRELLEPFEEQTEDPRFISFADREDEYRKEYETESAERVRTPKGELLAPWDERFRGEKLPKGHTKVTVPFCELYPTFEEFAEGWHRSQRMSPTVPPESKKTKPSAFGRKLPISGPAEVKRFGYWHNQNAKWDWWVIGGRWTGFFPLKPNREPDLGRPGAFGNKPDAGCGDIIRVDDIDMDLVAKQTREAAEKFWTEWQAFLDGKSDPFSGPRSKALSIGLLDVVQGPAEGTDKTKIIPWKDKVRPGDDRGSWNDVAKLVTRDEFLRDYIDCFCPITSYAALDDDGWHAPGEMGWFGASTDDPDSKISFQREFVKRFIKSAAPTDTLVVVDCHI